MDGGSNSIIWNSVVEGGWRQLNTQYIQRIRCIFIRQYKSLCINKANIKADLTRSFKTISVNDWIQWGDLSELAISEDSFLPSLMVKGG